MRLIDSSSIVKYFSKEPGWERAGEYLLGSVTLSLAIEELGNALWKKINKREIELKYAEEILTLYQSAATLVNHKECIVRALQISVKEKIAFYDALFLAVALVNGYEFVTSDRFQARTARKLDISVIEC